MRARRTSTRLLLLSTAVATLSACDWVDSTGRQNNSPPEIVVALDDSLWDGEVIALTESETSQVDLTGSTDSDGLVVAYRSELIEQGELEVCGLAENADSADNACEYRVYGDDCAVTFLESGAAGDDTEAPGRFTVIPPPLSSPVGMTYRWIVTDNDGSSSYQDMTFCLTPDEETPIAANDAYQVAYASTLTVPAIQYGDECAVFTGGESVLGNDTGTGSRERDCLQAELLSVPSGALNDFAADFSAAGGFRYQHNGAFNDTQDSFTYRAYDGVAWSEPATVTLDINNGNNKPPLANKDSFTVEGESNNNPLFVLGNDSDPEGYDLTLTAISTAPDAGGSASINSSGFVDYTPASGFVGKERFSYQVADAGGLSASAEVTVTVTVPDSAPVAVDDSFTVRAGHWVHLMLLRNDSDADGDALRIVSLGAASQGARVNVDLSADGVFFRANRSTRGIETFTYTIEDTDGFRSTATVSVNVRN